LSSPAPSEVAALPKPTSTPVPGTTAVPGPDLAYPAQAGQSVDVKPQPGAYFYHGDVGRTEVFITIDDCQNWANIDTDLETAKAKGVQLTLFPAGRYIDGARSEAARVLQKAVSYGDEIDNHTFSHAFIQPTTSTGLKGDLDAQLSAVRTALKDPTYREWFVRPPYGSGLDNQNLYNAARDDGLAVVRWSIDTSGYQTGSTVTSVMHNVFETNHFKNGAIILMHDDKTDMNALPLVIDTIRAKGFSVGGALRNILIAANATAAMDGRSQKTDRSYAEIAIRKEDHSQAI
jgi:peptidoglycan/xylan/chitin deacetylase (PgdA/CDA1 family)